MIKLYKLEEPQLLKDNKQSWTSEYIKLKSSNASVPDNLKFKYRHPMIKSQIKKETHDKCAYCESKVSHVCPGDVEHILPKKHCQDLIFEWRNLTLSCEQCNRTRKNDYYNPQEPLINPYVDNPAEHLMALGPMIFHRPGDKKGELTEKIIELNRKELIERRKERLESLINLADKWANESNIVLKEILKKQLLKEAEEDKEYSFIVKQFLENSRVI